jgi:hypothetical protein
MFPLSPFLTDLLIIIVYTTACILVTIRWKPRMWLHDLPADIQKMAAPKTDEEKRLTRIFAVPFIVIFLGLHVMFVWRLKQTLGTDFSFGSAWLYAYALFMGFNLWDLVILDWIGISLIDPQNPPIAGTQGAAGWHDYAFHFRGFLKGCVIGLVLATIIAGIVTVLP